MEEEVFIPSAQKIGLVGKKYRSCTDQNNCSTYSIMPDTWDYCDTEEVIEEESLKEEKPLREKLLFFMNYYKYVLIFGVIILIFLIVNLYRLILLLMTEKKGKKPGKGL